MKKIIGIFILFIGLTASIIEISSFVKESPWLEQQLNQVFSIANNAEYLSVKQNEESSNSIEIQEPLSSRPLITSSTIENWKEHTKAMKKDETNLNEVLCYEDCESTSGEESLAISHSFSNKPIDFEKLKQNLSPINDQD